MRKRFPAILIVILGVGLLAVSVTALFPPAAPSAPVPHTGALGTLDRKIATAQAKLARREQDPGTWAELGTAYVEKARITANPSYYPKADGALRTSLAQQPDANGLALIGMGALANARHDFTAARGWGERARAVLPDTAAAYGVLADAYTQLGDTAAATAAVQRMLDLKPGVSSFTRAAYDFELHGHVEQARDTLERALADAVDPGDIGFCRYRLGELAFDNGDLSTAARQYRTGLVVVPEDPALAQGVAKVAAARGETATALAGYDNLVSRLPSTQYLQEYAVLLTAANRPEAARRQFTIIDQQERLLTAAGATDDLAASLVAADRGDASSALRHARAEWTRRQPVFAADALAWALHLSGRHADAITYADRAAGLGWRNATFAYHRGMILAALGRDAEAITALDEALRVNPHFSPVDVRVARQTLSTLRGRR
ncbi:MAG: tetratricopeptide repeat protein [Actinophytocola sp.]|uniref:tetratricopeptide repeat protein n=1 Tax=Actinophytocola sp. TaxID=1872138 RepID=UPI003C75C807